MFKAKKTIMYIDVKGVDDVPSVTVSQEASAGSSSEESAP